MSDSVLFIISGPSGVGKGALIKEVLKKVKSLVLGVSATTRKKREGEEEGVDYYFMDRLGFSLLLKDNHFLESEEYGEDLYGTPMSELMRAHTKKQSIILEIDVKGAGKIREAFAEGKIPQQKMVSIFIAPPSMEVLEQRLRGRGTESGEKISTRLEEAEKELARKEEYCYITPNNNFDEAVKELSDIIRQEMSFAGIST